MYVITKPFRSACVTNVIVDTSTMEGPGTLSCNSIRFNPLFLLLSSSASISVETIIGSNDSFNICFSSISVTFCSLNIPGTSFDTSISFGILSVIRPLTKTI